MTEITDTNVILPEVVKRFVLEWGNLVPQSAAAAGLMRWCNARGTLHNRADTRTRLVEGLEQHLNDVQVEQVGCVALFSGRA